MPIPWVRRKSDEERAAEITAESIKGFGEKLQSISQADIKAKDRVDISLSEYLRMREELESTQRDLRHCREMLCMMGIPAEVLPAIKSDSIRVSTYKDPCAYKSLYQVIFEVDESYFIR